MVAAGVLDAAVEVERESGRLRVDGELLALVLEHHLFPDAWAQLAVDGRASVAGRHAADLDAADRGVRGHPQTGHDEADDVQQAEHHERADQGETQLPPTLRRHSARVVNRWLLGREPGRYVLGLIGELGPRLGSRLRLGVGCWRVEIVEVELIALLDRTSFGLGYVHPSGVGIVRLVALGSLLVVFGHAKMVAGKAPGIEIGVGFFPPDGAMSGVARLVERLLALRRSHDGAVVGAVVEQRVIVLGLHSRPGDLADQDPMVAAVVSGDRAALEPGERVVEQRRPSGPR